MRQRRRILIEPGFQLRLTARLAGWVALATALTGLVLWGVLSLQEAAAAGDYFYVEPAGGPPPAILSLSSLILPSVLLALAVNLTLAVLFTLFYTRRLAGPVHKLRVSLERLSRREKVAGPFRLRRNDEFHELADAFDRLLESRRGR